jgi:hypothetical protein
VTAGAVTVDSATNAGGASNALWVNAATISGAAATGGVWINDAATAPVTVASITTNGGPVVIGGQGNLDIQNVNAGSGSATLTSAAGAVLDGTANGSSAAHPNVTAGAVTVDSATNAGGATNALWVNAASISGSATAGGVWINDAATSPVTVDSVTAGAGPVVLGTRGNMLVGTITATGGGATLSSTDGAVLDGQNGGSNASHPNVTADSVTVNSATDGGHPADALWVDAATISATTTHGGVWINDAASTPVTVDSVTADGGPVVIGTQGNLLVGTVDAGSSDVTLTSATGSLLDASGGVTSPTSPNITGGLVTVNVAGTVGTESDRVYIDATKIATNASENDQFINIPPTPYPGLPLLAGVSPVTVFDANAQAQVQPPQELPVTQVGLPLELAPPINVAADLLGIALPDGVDAAATEQDATLDTASKPIFGGNDEEVGRKKAAAKAKKKGLKRKHTQGEG